MPNFNKDQIKSDLLDIAKDSLDSYLDVMKEEGADATKKGSQFAKVAGMLSKDVIAGVITEDQYKDGLDNIKLALESYLVAEGYRQSRKHLNMLFEILLKVARVAASDLGDRD